MIASGKYLTAFLCMISILVFCYVMDASVLNIYNTGWLFNHGDTSMGQISWQYFNSDSWQMPLGSNPKYGLEFSSGILMSDSNALFALIFKALSIEGAYQYFGLWLLVCFILQGYFAFKLANAVGISAFGSFVFSVFCIFSPIMIWRLYGHFNLLGHWLMLAALYYYFENKGYWRGLICWALLIAVSVLVHPYIGVMCCLIFAAFFFKELFAKRYSHEYLLVLGAACVASALFALWLGGYFLLAGMGGAGGFGLYRMNLLAFIQPFPAEWSHFLKEQPGFGAGDYEGNAYMGVGFILLLFLALPFAWDAVAVKWRKNIPLLVLCIGLFFFAISNNIGFGSLNFSYPLPEVVLKAFGLMRASGRFIWPVWYLLLLFVFFVLFSSLRSKQFFLAILSCLFIQVVDISDALSSMKERWREHSSSFQDGFWQEACNQYTAVRVFAPSSYKDEKGELWLNLGRNFSACGVPVTIARYTRDTFSPEKYMSAWDAFLASAEQGTLDEKVLYVLDRNSAVIFASEVPESKYGLVMHDNVYVVVGSSLGYKLAGDLQNFSFKQEIGRNEAGVYSVGNGEAPSGFLMYGPFEKFKAGNYKVVLEYSADSASGGWVDVFSNSVSMTSLARHDVVNGVSRVEIDFSLPKNVMDLEVRAYYGGKGSLSVRSAQIIGVP